MTGDAPVAGAASVLVWEAMRWKGLEYALLTTTARRPSARGTIVAMWAGDPLRLEYEVDCRADWTAERLEVRLETGSTSRRLMLVSPDPGSWSSADGRPMNILDGCLDVDLQATPLTNTLPIRRLALEAGESRVIRAAYVSVPDLQVSAIDQRYTRLANRGPRAQYRYQAGSFRRDLVVDANDAVTDYPRLWRRVYPPAYG